MSVQSSPHTRTKEGKVAVTILYNIMGKHMNTPKRAVKFGVLNIKQSGKILPPVQLRDCQFIYLSSMPM